MEMRLTTILDLEKLKSKRYYCCQKMVDGYLKLIYPDNEFTKEQLEEVLQFALEMRRRVKEQLKKIGWHGIL